MKKITYRPHHFLCTLGFQGEGYSPQFIQNFTEIVAQLQDHDGEQTVIEVVVDCDDICQPCPNRQGKLCQQQEKIEQLDRAHAKILQIKPGDQLSWQQAKEKLKQHMSLDRFHQACSSCPWKSYGYCERELRALQKLGTMTAKNKDFSTAPKSKGETPKAKT